MLLARARVEDAPTSIVSLAAQLFILRGDPQPVASLLADTRDDPSLTSARAVARSLELVDEGDFGAAINVLEESNASRREPAVASARALALYGAGRLDEALRSAASAPLTFETAAAQALFWLTRAANLPQSEEKDVAIAEAGSAASAAARTDPALGDGFLLRAQVDLEGSLDVEGGRRLLDTAVRKLGGRAWSTRGCGDCSSGFAATMCSAT